LSLPCNDDPLIVAEVGALGLDPVNARITEIPPAILVVLKSTAAMPVHDFYIKLRCSGCRSRHRAWL
jgi:hypothetical protein